MISPGRRRTPTAFAQMGAWLTIFNLFTGFAMGPANAAGSPPRPLRIVALGDSLTAGFMLKPAEAFPVQLEAALRGRGHTVTIVNAGVSGDTTGGGLARFDWAIPEATDGVILELGANDALRGIEPRVVRANLDRILERLGQRGIPVLIAGMKAPGNWGEDYAREFDGMFAELAKKHGTLLYPFFLDGIALEPSLNLGDGLHPNARGIARIVERILPAAEELLERARAQANGRAASRT